jgi:hypothetical protein
MVSLVSGSDMGKLLAGIAVAVCLPLASACVIEASAGAGASGGMAVSGPPPAPMEEGRPPPPGPHKVWIAGYWHWTGMQYTWIPGHWEDPRPGEQWRAPRYSMRDGTYYYEQGVWVGAGQR